MTTETTAPQASHEGNIPTQRPTGFVGHERTGSWPGSAADSAERYGSDPTAVRLAALIIGLFTGIVPMVVAYIIAAIVIPEMDGELAPGDRAAVAPGQMAILFGALLVVMGSPASPMSGWSLTGSACGRSR